MSKYDEWYNSLPEHTKRYLNNQPLWYDVDLAKAAAFGFAVGLIIGLCF